MNRFGPAPILLRVTLLIVAALASTNGTHVRPAFAEPGPELTNEGKNEKRLQKSNRPNVLFLSIDSLRADHVGSYGYERDTTPVIDALAENGLLFERTYSTTSWTLPAHTAMLTGLPDSAHGVVSVDDRLPDGLVTLAEIFQNAGYKTAGFYSGPFLSREFGFAQGFEQYIDCTSYGLDSDDKKATRAHQQSHVDITNPNIFWKVSHELTRNDERPFFYFIHFWDVHYDLIPPPPFDRMFFPEYKGSFKGHNFRHNPDFKVGMNRADFRHVIALYDGEIRFTDTTISMILDRMRAMGALENTLVVVTSDHGEEFLEHGNKGHRRTLYEEVTRVPLVFHMPGTLKPKRIKAPVSIVDIAPTILDIVGLANESEAMGRSLLPLAKGDQDATISPAMSELTAPPRAPNVSSLVVGHDKIIRDKKRGDYYFDLKNDPGEINGEPLDSSDQGKTMTETLDSVRSAAKAYSKRFDKERAEKKATEIPEKTVEQLKSLGYLD